MNAAFEDAIVFPFEHRIASMPNEESDRHCVALAIESNSETIVTANL